MISAVIQSTYKSTVFPGKGLVKIQGRSVLEWIVRRLKKMNCLREIVLATSENSLDDTLCDEAHRLGIKYYRGSESDVILRLYKSIENSNCDTILKINGNYPLVDQFLALELLNIHIQGNFDYCFNEHVEGTIYGTGCEIVKKSILKIISEMELTPEQRESGTLYLRQNISYYNSYKYLYEAPRPSYKVCFDTEKDLKLIDFIIKHVDDPQTKEIVTLLDSNQIIAESNRFETIKEIGVEKLLLFPEKINALKAADFSEPDHMYPVSVELSLTNRCNLRCVWCSDKKLREKYNGDLELNIIKRVLFDLKKGGTKGIVIEGGGEPTLHKQFSEVVNYVCDIGLGLGLITNGSKSLKNNILSKFEWIRVSLDASNFEEQKRLKGSENFEKIMSNINAYCSSGATVGVGYVISKHNTGSIEPLILRLSNFGVNYIQFRPVIDHPELFTNIDLGYLKRYEHYNFSVIIDGMNQNTTKGNSGLPCVAHSLTSVISADGSVYLCGRLNIYDWTEPIGNICHNSFRDIWYGEKRHEQTQMVLNSSFCLKYCPECRMTKFNRLFHQMKHIRTKNFI